MSISELLGYPRHAKLLIVHADDLGMTHSINQATFAALETGTITSASVMAPCPWFAEAAEFARAHPDADIGVHLTLTCGWDRFRWGPISGRDRVPSLIDPEGYFWPTAQLLGEHARIKEAELEIRAQIDHVLQSGIVPTHLDSHMFAHAFNPELSAAYRRVAREYRLPFLMAPGNSGRKGLRKRCVEALDDHPRIRHMLRGDYRRIVLDGVYYIEPRVAPECWKEAYLNILRSLKPGINQLIVHLGYDDAELKATAAPDRPWGSEWRQRDCEVINSPEFASAIEENNIHLMGWKHLKALQQDISPHPQGNGSPPGAGEIPISAS